jgi:hypothetical protein
MRTPVTIFVATLLLVMVGPSRPAPSDLPGKVTIWEVHGKCEYQTGNSWHRIRRNMQFDPGVVLRTDAKSSLEASINGKSSAILMRSNTVVAVPIMVSLDASANKDTETVLDLRTGFLLGHVKRLSSNSQYEIKTPHGTAKPEGTDYVIISTPQPDGTCEVSFNCITGHLHVTATNSPPVDQTLRDGQSWIPGKGGIHPTPLDLLKYLAISEIQIKL